MALSDPVYAGLMVCSHEAGVKETALFSDVTLKNDILRSGVKRVRETSLETVSVATGERKIVYHARAPFEAPNWSLDEWHFQTNSFCSNGL